MNKLSRRLAVRAGAGYREEAIGGSGKLTAAGRGVRRNADYQDFSQQLRAWLIKASSRTVRSIHGCLVDLLERDYLSMTPLPPVDPPTGLSSRIGLARDYYVQVDTG